MAVFKCKMCGGNLDFEEGLSVTTCEYCGTQQTLPKFDNDATKSLFNRANSLRLKNEFDKAQEIYEKIISTGSTDAEAYWGNVLCKFGIEYVEDPSTFKRVPTCHRTQLESVLSDIDYKSAIENADASQKNIYEAEAKAIDELQKNILSIVGNEKPFDVFICYKETDESGKRTPDSVLANDIYHLLTQEGFKVFYAAITLEDKLGQEYEPYIFSALNSAKVMLVIGTRPEYFNAVWVRNEWSRFLKIIKNDRSKLLIPCYKDMDAYELPEEFAHLQAQDMGKIGFIQDIIRGINKIIRAEDAKFVNAKEKKATNLDDNYREIAFADGYYIGEAIANQPNGYGTRMWTDGTKHEGLWKFGKRNGQGTCYYANGDKFEGEFKDDAPYNGYGHAVYKNGYYVGQIVNGCREGKGVFIKKDGTKIDGEFKNDKIDGYVVKYFPNGDKFEGEYKNGSPYDGFGRVNLAEGAYYIGRLKKGSREGKGVYVDKQGNRTEGEFEKNMLNSKGCYVATAVYGSYDCPEVWTLRRYRDYTLAQTWYGRAFIRTYYAISPTLVKLFGRTEWFKKMWQGRLDKMVADLQEKGFESTPYEDKKW